ncbi:MAG: glycosyl transferase [Bacteroidetes bacterium HGW-Bacteroidetes-3]|jgi:glycosyltransferase involved in cell wall biosynthesis|nr:MAG: glycosyl transferase [Bacteroidetes bacterium HGW-Bacteroidetes-3]
MNPSVSIITACYNAADFIEETIQSVQNQYFTNWEWFIVDDFSTDNSVSIIAEYAKNDARIKLLPLKKNSGAAIARNMGIALTKGNYMTFIDADDVWKPQFLAENVARISKTEGFLCSSYEMYDVTLKLKLGELIVPKYATYSAILKTNTISCLTAFIDISRLGKEFMPEIKYRQDMGLWLKYLKKINRVEGIQESLAIYRIRKQSLSNNKVNLLKHQWSFYREFANLSILQSSYYFTLWMFYGSKKYWSLKK